MCVSIASNSTIKSKIQKTISNRGGSTSLVSETEKTIFLSLTLAIRHTTKQQFLFKQFKTINMY